MGFTLADVRSVLAGPDYDVVTSLAIQQEAIDRRLAELGEASHALQATLEKLDTAEEPNWARVAAMIRAVTADHTHEWKRRYGIDL